MKYGPIVCNPMSKEAEVLVGKRIVGSISFSSINKVTCLCYDGTLDSIDTGNSYPFRITDYSDDHDVTFIREVIEEKPKYIPYDLSKKEVRDKLRGRWFNVKETKNEMTVNDLLPPDEDGLAFINGFTQDEFLEQCEWIDGTPCGEEVIDG